MKNKILCLALSLLLVAGLFGANSAYAWFVTSAGGSGEGPSGSHLISTGNIGFIITGGFKDLAQGTKIVPEDELLEDLSAENAQTINTEGCKMFIANSSTIDTQLRIRVEYTYNGNTEAYDASATCPLTVEMSDAAGWSYDSGYLYYGTYADNSSAVLTAPAVGEPQNIPLFNSIRYSGENTESASISGATVNVKVIFEARQSEFVDWTAVGTIYVSA